jgi:hypothetical protein
MLSTQTPGQSLSGNFSVVRATLRKSKTLKWGPTPDFEDELMTASNTQGNVNGDAEEGVPETEVPPAPVGGAETSKQKSNQLAGDVIDPPK